MQCMQCYIVSVAWFAWYLAGKGNVVVSHDMSRTEGESRVGALVEGQISIHVLLSSGKFPAAPWPCFHQKKAEKLCMDLG